jgi:hypothetical protein
LPGLHLRESPRYQREYVLEPGPPPGQAIIDHRYRQGRRFFIRAQHIHR